MKKIIILLTLSLTFVFGALYDTQNNKLNNFLMSGDFKTIIRFKPLIIDSTTYIISNDSKKELQKIVDTLKQYKNKKVIVTIIGYTNSVESHNKQILQDTVFHIKHTNTQLKKDSIQQSLKYANSIKKYLIDHDIIQKLIVQAQGDCDQFFTEATNLGKQLNNRVMVTIYEQ